jgi:hypothetical protein
VQDRIDEGPHLVAPPRWRPRHAWIVPLHVIGEQTEETLEIAGIPGGKELAGDGGSVGGDVDLPWWRSRMQPAV